MGNSWTTASTASTVIRIVRLDGQVQEFHEPIWAADLALTNPNFLVCHPADLRLGLRPRALHTDTILRPGRLYFLLPVRFFQSPLTGKHLSSLLQKAYNSEPLLTLPSKKIKHRPDPAQFQLLFGCNAQPLCLIENDHTLRIVSSPEIFGRLIDEGLLPGSSTVSNVSVCQTPAMQAKYLKHLIARSRSWMPRLDTIDEAVGSQI